MCRVSSRAVTSPAYRLACGLTAAALLPVLSGCPSTPDPAAWRITFAGGAAPAGTVVVHAEVRTGGCAGEVRFADDVRSGEAVGMSPGSLPPGTWGFYAEARDTGCAVLAQACVERVLPVEDGIVVVLPSSGGAGVAACEPGVCDDGVCGGLRVDAGVDAGLTDLGPDASVDLGVRDDLGASDDLGVGDDLGAPTDLGTSEDLGPLADAGMPDLGPPPDVVRMPVALSARNSHILYGAPADRLASAGDDGFSQRAQPRAAAPMSGSFESFTGGLQFVSVAATQFTAYGLTGDGSLFAWGTNVNGLLGNGVPSLTFEQAMPAQVGSSLWRAVDGGNEHVCGIRGDGRLFCWGLRSDGRLGTGGPTGSASAPATVGTALWRRISAGERHTCGIQEDGSLWCWGYNSSNGGMGPMGSGQLGVGDTLDRNVPTRVGVGVDWSEVSAGTAHTCAIQTDGSLWCWGEQSNWGRLGLGVMERATDVLTPERVTSPVATWTQVAAGNFHTCAIGDGDLYCWGISARGQTGTGAADITYVPTLIRNDFDAVAVAADHSCGRSSIAADPLSAWFCWGRIADGRTGTGIDPAPDGGVAMDLLSPTPAVIAP